MTRMRVLILAVSPACLALSAMAQDFEARREAQITRCADEGQGAYRALCRLARGLPSAGEGMAAELAMLHDHAETGDFRLVPILRLLYQYGEDPNLDPAAAARMREAVLAFKYWPDEPGQDSMCTWTENHQLLFAGGGYLAGRLLPEATFTNSGKTGRQMVAVHRPRVLRWLDLRYQTGFSEWLSNVYYMIDVGGLVNLIDFGDEEVSRKATMVLDLLLLDMALNSHEGVFGSTHGRSYERHKKWPATEGTSQMAWLLFGTGRGGVSNIAAVSLALSTQYRMPAVIRAIALDGARPRMVNRQRMGIRVAEGPRWGIGYENFEDGMVWLSLEAYVHPLTIDAFINMLDTFHWWENDYFAGYRQHRDLIEEARAADGGLRALATAYEHDLCRNTREEVNIHTFRTPDYMLSTAQDYRKGYGGDQQHIWQATLGGDAVCFSTHPAGRAETTPNYWTGCGYLPRAAQVANVAIVLHDASEQPALYVKETLDFTHVWLPKDKFDEVTERDGWVFARKGSAYLALHSSEPYYWQANAGEDLGREMIAPGRKNVYICELGRAAEDGSFEDFVARVQEAPLHIEGLQVRYDSPAQGRLEFAWEGPLRRNGREVPLGNYPRYDNPYMESTAAFPPGPLTVRAGAHVLRHDWSAGLREAGAAPPSTADAGDS